MPLEPPTHLDRHEAVDLGVLVHERERDRERAEPAQVGLGALHSILLLVGAVDLVEHADDDAAQPATSTHTLLKGFAHSVLDSPTHLAHAQSAGTVEYPYTTLQCPK